MPYSGPAANHVQNGILLRSDLHTLLDLNLFVIDPEAVTVEIDASLQGTSYDWLAGKRLNEAKRPEWAPSAEALRYRASVKAGVRSVAPLPFTNVRLTDSLSPHLAPSVRDAEHVSANRWPECRPLRHLSPWTHGHRLRNLFPVLLLRSKLNPRAIYQCRNHRRKSVRRR